MSKLYANEVAEATLKRYNARSFKGQTIRNASGDIDQSTLGYQIAIDTLTYIKKQVTEQKFYTVAPADYVPIAVGDGAFSQNILTNQVTLTSTNFEAGIINQGGQNDRLATSDVGVASKTLQVISWAMAIGYSIIEIEQALQANNWDLIESKHKARKKVWDLGIQQTCFLGNTSNNLNVPGLLTNTGVSIDTSTIYGSGSISSMSAGSFSTFIQTILGVYQNNNAYTALPTHFVVPQDDYLGLASPVSSTYPFNSKLQYLKDAFAALVPGGVKILPSPYSMPSYNKTVINVGTGNHVYAMYRYDEESIRMDIPVDYTTTSANTVNGFQFQDTGFGQFTGVGIYRLGEVQYFYAP